MLIQGKKSKTTKAICTMILSIFIGLLLFLMAATIIPPFWTVLFVGYFVGHSVGKATSKGK